MRKVYLDYAATSPTKPEVLEAMRPYFSDKFGNPSSLHSFGQEARKAIDKAREQVAKFLNCKPTEIIFTSGGTESDNLTIRGVVYAHWCHENTPSVAPARRPRLDPSASLLRRYVGDRARSACGTVFFGTNSLPHIITSQIEHHAVLHTCQDLEKQDLVEVTYLPVDKYGRVSVEDTRKAIKENTVLVSIMYANNEIGTIEPIREIGKLIEKINLQRQATSNKRKGDSKSLIANRYSLQPVRLHTDAVQAIGYLNCDVKHLHVDMLSLSAHKFGGPKGVGALYVKEGTPIKPIITGGGQEYKKRAGTENVPGIVGLGKAVELINSSTHQLINSRIHQLRDKLINGALKKIPDIILTGHQKERLPNSTSFCIKYVEGESMLINLDLKGVAASTGSACTSGSLEPSHVLLACGFDHQTTQGSLRLTLGDETTKEEIDYVLKILPPIIEKLRKMSPFGPPARRGFWPGGRKNVAI